MEEFFILLAFCVSLQRLVSMCSIFLNTVLKFQTQVCTTDPCLRFTELSHHRKGAWVILVIGSANDIRRYTVASSLIG